MKTARDEGRAEGRAEGISLGMQRGKAEGRTEGVKIVIYKMISKGMEKKLIANMLEMTEEEINRLVDESEVLDEPEV